MQRLLDSSEPYGAAIKIQRDRLNISGWLQERVTDSDDPLVAVASAGREKLEHLTTAPAGIEIQLRAQPGLSESFDKERLRLRREVDEATGKLIGVRQEIAQLEQRPEEAGVETFPQDQVERFIGRMEYALTTLDRSEEGSGLADSIARLQRTLAELRRIYSEGAVNRRRTRFSRCRPLPHGFFRRSMPNCRTRRSSW